MKSVWRLSTPREEEKTFGKHPTQNRSRSSPGAARDDRPGDVVFDPLAGSGSTGVAALTMERSSLAAKDETYAALAARRLDGAARGRAIRHRRRMRAGTTLAGNGHRQIR